MNTGENWDVEQYKAEHECDEHWELRRKFLVRHKDKFPEDELICLAQVFTNVELLGCRYPKETMQLIVELAKDVAAEYREKQKTRIQRTFVKASDAASSKVKGLSHQIHNNFKTRTTYSTLTQSSTQAYCIPHPKKLKLDEEPFGKVVIVKRLNDTPQNTLGGSINICGGKLEWKHNKTQDTCECTVIVNSKDLATASGPNQKMAKKTAAIVALEELQKYYYTIKINQEFSKDADVTTAEMLSKTSTEESISDDNIGKKLMKLMGWTGGGLGKSQQGIVEPVTIMQHSSKQGLGLTSNSFTLKDLRTNSRNIMKNYFAEDTNNDLVFSNEFTNEERAVIHQIAREMGLKSHSYGRKNQRKLVISRKLNIWDLVAKLKSQGGVTDKYELIEPTLVKAIVR
ncbi:hypothetical protein KM043_017558 [Ampulex compressa]|nr:hypothetical protein KM043_017558 [Ampulex compressa]